MGGIRIQEFLYPELSYQIVGLLFQVRRELGSGYQEKHVQRAIVIAFNKVGLEFQEQVPAVLEFDGHTVGRYFLDFVVANKIIVELKVCERPSKRDFDQIKQYLVRSKLKLGLLACFGRNGVKIYRVLQPK